MEFKYLPLEWKASSEGVIEGYGSVFGTLDLGNDIILPGAFAASLKSGRKVKMLREHCADDLIGVWDEVSEDANGLRVKGRLLLTIDDGKTAFELVKSGALDGLSIGYRTVDAEYNNSGNRLLKQLDLWEVSLVTFPMEENSRIDSVKAAGMARNELERLLTLRAGLSRSVARTLLAKGYDGINDMRGAVDGVEELAQLLRQRAAI